MGENIQGSPEWKAARLRRLGGSEIAAVMRVSPYKTRRELWREKVGLAKPPEIGHLPHVQRGVEAEPVAREWIESAVGVKYTTPVLVHPKYPWAVASLDGLCQWHTLEIKTMGRDKHLELGRSGVVPIYYEMQCQWGLWILGDGRPCLFASYRPEDGTLFWNWIKPDPVMWAEMETAAVEFWGWVERREEPPDEFVWRG